MDTTHQAGWIVAIFAGFTAFFSPCILPLIPGYLSMVSGLSYDQLKSSHLRNKSRIFITCMLFAIGLCAIFIPMGVAAGLIGNWLLAYNRLLNIVFGLVIILFGLFMMGVLKLTFLYRDWRFRWNQNATGLWAAPVMGMAFGAGWSPCLGPWIGTLFNLAKDLSPAQSALLFGIFGAVFGLCFVVAGVLFSHMLRTFSFFQKHYRVVELIGGGFLVVMGGLMVTGWWDMVAARLSGLFA